MTVRALFFGHWRDRAGTGSLSLSLADGASVADAARALAERNPKLGEILTKVRVAVGEEFATPETVLKQSDEIAFLPPMSGG